MKSPTMGTRKTCQLEVITSKWFLCCQRIEIKNYVQALVEPQGKGLGNA